MIEEDDELLALRSAALASINKPRKPQKEAEDLDALRQAALKSRKLSEDDEDNIFHKLQPPKSSNLINLTPDPNAALPPSPKPKDKFNRCSSESSDESDSESVSSQSSRRSSVSSSIADSESGDSSQDEESSNQSENEDPEKHETKIPEVPVTSKPEDDDILNAIDQFLGGDFDVGEKKSDEPKKEPKEPKSKPKVKKKLKKKEKNKEKGRSNINADDSKENKVPLETDKKTEENPHVKTKAEDIEPTRKEKTSSTDKNHRSQKMEKSKDFVEKESRKKGIEDNDSVHSSDLSFLSDSSDDGQDHSGSRKTSQPSVKLMSDSTDHQYKSDFKGKSNGSGSKIISLKSSSRQRSKFDTKTPDLRTKLKGRGLPRNHEEQKKNDSLVPSVAEKEDGITKKSSKIYVKPSLVGKAQSNEKKDILKRQSEDNIVITRKVTNERYVEKSVKIAPGVQNPEEKKSLLKPILKQNSEEKKKKNSKRSVIQFSPYTPDKEKREKIASLMKNAPKLNKAAQKNQSDDEKSLSDMSEQNFDAFEIADDFDTEVSETSKEPEPLKRRRKSSQSNVLPSDTRVFITAGSPVSDKTSLSSSSGELSDSPPSSPSAASSGEEEQEKPHPKPKRPIRDRLGVQVKSFSEKKERSVPERRLDARTKLTRRRSKEEVRRKRRTKDPVKEDLRGASISEDEANDFFRSVDKPKFPSSVISTVTVKKSPYSNHDFSVTNDETVHRKKRRRVGLVVNEKKARITIEKPNSRTIRERLGGSNVKKVSHTSPDRKRKRLSPSKQTAPDREKELDARMKRIREQNEAIIRRRQEIEMEEKRFRLT
uniref:Zinc finger CCCH domain-containing protein 13 n=1 Tax=Phallusia mammillata TaxID=59560 RepID=A0A6F9DYD1_9ASCI|nr:zinc finger CCCH domain-containing protein 13 [Phallusia mammillata]